MSEEKPVAADALEVDTAAFRLTRGRGAVFLALGARPSNRGH